VACGNTTVPRPLPESVGFSASFLEEAKERGDIAKHHDPQETARFLYSAWQGAVIDSKVTRNRAAFDNYLAVVFDFILKR
jgi:hypothetical protein